MAGEFVAAVRSMLVPVAPQLEGAYHQFVAAYLDGLGVAEADRANWINVELRRWRHLGTPGSDFRRLVRTALYDAARAPSTFMFESAVDGEWHLVAKRASEQYFTVHADFSKIYLLDHDAARQLLAQSGMIARLQVVEQMSASEIARLFAARDIGFSHQWRVVQRLLQGFGRAPSLGEERVQQIYQQDKSNELALLGDLDLGGSVELTARVASDLGCGGDVERLLLDLFVRDVHEPYLLILHYQMTILADYDHAVTYAYEFSPRGAAVAWLNQQYIAAGIPVGLNAFLNNAKALLRFDQSWVTGRPDHRRSANALASILALIESLGALAKTEVANRVRGLLHRFIRLSEQEGGALPHQLGGLSQEQFKRVFAGIAESNSATTGIAEQRLVDCWGVLRHPTKDGWSARGVGDSVFAPNLPRRKCGDCEFELARFDGPRISAYESHGGQLSASYVEDHLSSLRQTIRARAEDLAAVSPLKNWNIEVTFVAHSTLGVLPAQEMVQTDHGEVTVTLNYTTFAAAAGDLIAAEEWQLLVDCFVTPLNSGYVHPRIRQRIIELQAG